MASGVRVCGLDELEPGAARLFELEGHRLCVVRIGDDVYVIGDTCTHQDISLAEGEVYTDEREIECWKHGSTFSLTTGVPTVLPATKPTPTYDVAVEGNDVVVRL